ncbi:CBS domain-containing protein [Robertmurraya yapensis]|uniref:CBS domain-containing protein n=1 Tax=Bacillus yapensis TaxID=2492960 RepID=A0A3S0KAW2_9BACI|nr:CBS domain-containing protein [Bacillus yapensis]RTR26576.1 CBS domain-containing protein [Bacillus yapensis]TKS93751.1 CBS domain-containing protein [Bacillus yapensis]
MNIAFFLLPKSEVVYLNFNRTMRQALEKMEYHRYSAIPIIDHDGKYIGTLTEGDLLWKLKNTPDLNFRNTDQIMLSEIPLHVKNEPISVNEEMEAIIARAKEQNFVPVVDDNGIFIGIIRRREIIEYCANQLFKVLNQKEYHKTKS